MLAARCAGTDRLLDVQEGNVGGGLGSPSNSGADGGRCG